jgi:hypothetical protein
MYTQALWVWFCVDIALYNNSCLFIYMWGIHIHIFTKLFTICFYWTGSVSSKPDARRDGVCSGGVLWADRLWRLLCVLLLWSWIWRAQSQLHSAQWCAYRLQDWGVLVSRVRAEKDAGPSPQSLLHDFGYLSQTVSIVFVLFGVGGLQLCCSYMLADRAALSYVVTPLSNKSTETCFRLTFCLFTGQKTQVLVQRGPY